MKTSSARPVPLLVTFALILILAAGLVGIPRATAQEAGIASTQCDTDTFTQPDGPAQRWTPRAGDETSWAVENGEYSGSVAANSFAYTFLNGSQNWTDYKVEVSVLPLGLDVENGWRAGLVVRTKPHPGSNEYDGYMIHSYWGGLRILKMVDGGNVAPIHAAWFHIPTDVWHTLGVEVEGNQLKFYYNGALVKAVTDTGMGGYPALLSGAIALRVWGHTATPHMHFDDVTYCAPCSPPAPGLLSWWPGEGDASDVVDGNHGTLHNGATFGPGMVGQGFVFDGADDYVATPTTGFPTGNSDRTLELWVKLDAVPPGEAFFAGYGAFGEWNQTYHLGTVGLALFFSQWGGALWGPALSTGVWHHIAVTNIGEQVTLYLNGVAVNSAALPIDTPAVAQFYMGRVDSWRVLDGSVDEVSIYDRALSAAEILAIYNAGCRGKCSNEAPIVDAGPDGTLDEGDTFSGSGSFTDPDADTWTATVDYGDGSGEQALPLDGQSFDLSHVYADNGTYTVLVTVDDGQGGVASDTAEATVENVAPTVGPISAPLDPVPVGAGVVASAPFADPGVLDTHSAAWDWGDGSTSAGTVVASGGSGTVEDNHTYALPGIYTVQLTVTDKDGDSGTAQFQYVVIYNPDGGFVTGGGWIQSPAGTYTHDPALAGKASFGFVSKYQKGATVPTGNTEFQFKASGLNFHSEAYEWLVIAGAKAKYKGTGTINGAGNYGFMLSAIDGALVSGGGVDKFRIKIWDKANSDTIVYDNQQGAADDAEPSTAIGGGSIVIHQVK